MYIIYECYDDSLKLFYIQGFCEKRKQFLPVNESAGLLSWLLISLGRNKLLKAVEILCNIKNNVRSLALLCP